MTNARIAAVAAFLCVAFGVAAVLAAYGDIHIGETDANAATTLLGVFAGIFGAGAFAALLAFIAGSAPPGRKQEKVSTIARKLEDALEETKTKVDRALDEKKAPRWPSDPPLEDWKEHEDEFARLNRRYDQPVRTAFRRLAALKRRGDERKQKDETTKKLEATDRETLKGALDDIGKAEEVLDWLQQPAHTRLIAAVLRRLPIPKAPRPPKQQSVPIARGS